jgi:cytochrome P450
VTMSEQQTESGQNEAQKYQARMYDVIMRASAEPEIAAALAGADPQPAFAELAAKCPVRDLGDGTYGLMRIDDIRYVNAHHAVEQGSKYLGSNRPAIPLGLDGPEHRKYRRLLDPVFAPKRVALLAGQVRQLADELIDKFVDAGAIDAYAAWCQPLPSMMFLSIMGLPPEQLDNFIHFKNLTLGVGDPTASLEERMARQAEAVVWIQNYFTVDLDAREREEKPRDDMIGWLLTTEVEGDRLTRADMLDILGLLMIAGLDTVTSSLACFLSYFARHPGHRAQVVADPALTRPAVEELMRFESPVAEGFRIAREDLTLPSGARIPAGSWMHMSWTAANLDPAVFPNPLTVDFTRKPNPHIGFASGVHRCLGSHLARMEMAVAINTWHERIPDYSIAPGEVLVYSGNPRAPHPLPLVWS